MRKMVSGILLICVLLAGFKAERVDIGKLIPVSAVKISIDDGMVILETDTGDWGTGESLQNAVQDMKDSAKGILYMDTAEYLLMGKETEPMLAELAAIMRKECKVVKTDEKINPKEAAKYLDAHRPTCTIRDAIEGKEEIPNLRQSEGSYRLDGS